MQKFDFSCDTNRDDMFLHNNKSKSKGSVEIGDMVLDFNSHKELVGIQFMNASQLIREMAGLGALEIREILANLDGCNVHACHKNNLLVIRIQLSAHHKEIAPMISIPRITESSPAICA
jgi:uncharacterized protein YuzE